MGISSILFNKREIKFGYEEAVKYSKYLGNAKEEIKIVAGELYAPYYSNPEVLEQFMSAIRNGVKIKIIFGPSVYIECKDILKLAYKGAIELFKLPVRIDNHFRVIDKQHVYISEPHGIDTDAKERKDQVIEWGIKPSPDGELYEYMFDKLCEKYSKKITGTKIIEEFRERKVEFYEEGDKKGKVKTSCGFIKMDKNKIRAATDEEIMNLKEYITT